MTDACYTAIFSGNGKPIVRVVMLVFIILTALFAGISFHNSDALLRQTGVIPGTLGTRTLPHVIFNFPLVNVKWNFMTYPNAGSKPAKGIWDRSMDSELYASNSGSSFFVDDDLDDTAKTSLRTECAVMAQPMAQQASVSTNRANLDGYAAAAAGLDLAVLGGTALTAAQSSTLMQADCEAPPADFETYTFNQASCNEILVATKAIKPSTTVTACDATINPAVANYNSHLTCYKRRFGPGCSPTNSPYVQIPITTADKKRAKQSYTFKFVTFIMASLLVVSEVATMFTKDMPPGRFVVILFHVLVIIFASVYLTNMHLMLTTKGSGSTEATCAVPETACTSHIGEFYNRAINWKHTMTAAQKNAFYNTNLRWGSSNGHLESLWGHKGAIGVVVMSSISLLLNLFYVMAWKSNDEYAFGGVMIPGVQSGGLST